MLITHLGHAGFLVETESVVVAMDPWMSPDGGIDSSWYQYPRNHHLGDFVREKLRDSSRQRYIYISHEHKDHFDPEFLASLEPTDFTYLIPRFRRNALEEGLKQFFGSKEVVALSDAEPYEIAGGYIKLFLADSELNRDSAILTSLDGNVFLNLNDCKIYDRMSEIRENEGPIDAFSAQFSGATFHPTCYDYPKEQYQRISLQKINGKFESVACGIEDLRCRVFVPSAGPPCFLEPEYIERNFEPVNIYARVPKFFRFLDRRLKNSDTTWVNMMPGDVLDPATGDVDARGTERVDEDDDFDFEAYVRSYASDYEEHFAQRRREAAATNPADVLVGLERELSAKLKSLTLRDRIEIPLYFELIDLPGRMLLVDFQADRITEVGEMRAGDYYKIGAQSSDIRKILAGETNWQDFMGTFRAQLSRNPDSYNTLVASFLLTEAEDLEAFCQVFLDRESLKERTVVQAGGVRYEVDRYCPHLGGDLCDGTVERDRYLICPRHRWRFDLTRGGECVGNNGTVNAKVVDEK